MSGRVCKLCVALVVVFLVLAWTWAAPPARRVINAPRGGQVLDRAKLLSPDLDSTQLPTLVANPADRRFDLATILAPGQDRASITWTADASPVPNGILEWTSQPDRDHARAVTVTASRGTEGDSFVLVLVPAETRKAFESWHQSDSLDTAWLASLPRPYARLGPGFTNPEPSNCPKQYWRGVRKIESNYHPGARYEMRSERSSAGTGHQATYDENGVLLINGVAAGSADRGSPSWWIGDLRRHAELDIKPFIWAAQLDGNPVNPKTWFTDIDEKPRRIGDNIRRYLTLRPPFSPGKQLPLPPGECGP